MSGWDGSAPVNLDYVILGDSFSIERANALSAFDRFLHASTTVHVSARQDDLVFSFFACGTEDLVLPVHEF